MRRILFALALVAPAALLAAAPPAAPAWKAKVIEAMPLLGHRNWILIVDSAYPLQSSPGVETVETNADQLEVVQYVLGAIGRSIHVRPVLTMDAELPFVPEADAPGVTAYRDQIARVLAGMPVASVAHEQVIAQVGEAGRQFHVLVLKTRLAVPYTSVFIRLDCKYWSSEAEDRLRARMAEAATQNAAAKPGR